jgi:TPR repeat protein
MVILAAFLTNTACAQVEETAGEASARLNQWFSADSETAPATAEDAERLHEDGLAARRRGDDELAFARLLQAAEANHGPAAYEVGIAYKDGRGTDQDLEAGARWIDAAAERGEARAQLLLGAAYYGGIGVERDYRRAAAYLADAAVQGQPQAQFLLAECFSNGRGVTKNPIWAARWYGKAATQGHRDAQFAYGVVHSAGLGLPRNPVAGHAWLSLAAAQGHTKAKEVVAALAKKMTPQQIHRAESKAAGFRSAPNEVFADRPTVIYVQQSLNILGFDAGPVDGVVGPRTRGAIREFEGRAKLAGDGEVSPELLRGLLAEQNQPG